MAPSMFRQEALFTNNSNGFFVGLNGTGVLTVNGGQFGSPGFIALAANFGDVGTATVSNGGIVNAGSLILGGFYGGGTGYLTVTGAGSQWNNAQNAYVGVPNGTGSLTIDSGGLLSSHSGVIAADAGSTGIVFINGTSSKWTLSGDVTVGTGGMLDVSGGGTLDVSGGNFTTSGNVSVGAGGGSSQISAGSFTENAGTTTVNAGGTMSVSGDINVNGGVFQVLAGGVVDPVSVYVNGGTALIDGSLTATTVSVGSGGALAGRGTITGDLISDGVSPLDAARICPGS
jgi:T5SS/PEP-CTERM-associated repeat protein